MVVITKVSVNDDKSKFLVSYRDSGVCILLVTDQGIFEFVTSVASVKQLMSELTRVLNVIEEGR